MKTYRKNSFWIFFGFHSFLTIGIFLGFLANPRSSVFFSLRILIPEVKDFLSPGFLFPRFGIFLSLGILFSGILDFLSPVSGFFGGMGWGRQIANTAGKSDFAEFLDL